MIFKNKAFSLVEVLISLVVLTFGIISMFNLFPLAMSNIAYSRKLGDVALLAQEKFEELKSQSGILIGKTNGKDEDLEWELTVASIKFPDNIEVVQAELDINFTFQKGTHKEKFVTYLFTRGGS